MATTETAKSVDKEEAKVSEVIEPASVKTDAKTEAEVKISSKKSESTVMASTSQFGNIANILKGMKNESRSSNMLDHMNEVFNTLVLHYPKNSVDKLEEVSYLLK
jgi:hypothetical protein